MEKSYKITGEGIIRDYLMNSPESVLSISASEVIQKRLRVSGGAKNIRWNVGETVPTAMVRVEPWDEAQFERSLSQKTPQRIVFLDHIVDPRNLGAIVRTCAFFGMPFVVVPKDRQVLVTDASVATAQGGFSVTRLVVVGNLLRTLERCRENFDFWTVAADMDGDADFVEKPQSFWPKNLALVFGSEEKGISRAVLKAADFKIRIGDPKRQKIESLNVSVAAAILLHHFSRGIS